MVANRLHEYICNHHLSNNLQSAYKRFHSTETALLKIYNDIVDNMDNGKVTALTLLLSKLQLNPDKIDLIIIGTKQHRNSIINRRIRRQISISAAKTTSTALISSRLDYCNSILNNIAKRDLAKLPRVQNCLARVVLRAPRFSPSLPLLRQLHWLPVSNRINAKLSTLTYRAISTQQPHYSASLLHLSNIPTQLRSSISQQLFVPKTKLTLGKRAFSVASPRVWNELPINLKTSETIAIFRKKLKTYLLQIAFPPNIFGCPLF